MRDDREHPPLLFVPRLKIGQRMAQRGLSRLFVSNIEHETIGQFGAVFSILRPNENADHALIVTSPNNPQYMLVRLPGFNNPHLEHPLTRLWRETGEYVLNRCIFSINTHHPHARRVQLHDTKLLIDLKNTDTRKIPRRIKSINTIPRQLQPAIDVSS